MTRKELGPLRLDCEVVELLTREDLRLLRAATGLGEHQLKRPQRPRGRRRDRPREDSPQRLKVCTTSSHGLVFTVVGQLPLKVDRVAVRLCMPEPRDLAKAR